MASFTSKGPFGSKQPKGCFTTKGFDATSVFFSSRRPLGSKTTFGVVLLLVSLEKVISLQKPSGKPWFTNFGSKLGTLILLFHNEIWPLLCHVKNTKYFLSFVYKT